MIFLYGVTPKERTWGYEAPEVFVEAEDAAKAVEAVEKKSPLSKFPNWSFSEKRARKIAHNGRLFADRIKKRRSEED